MKRNLVILGVILIALIGWMVYRTYPRHISQTIKGVEYKLGSPKQEVKPITLQLNGELVTSLFEKRKFVGVIYISGSTVMNKGNGEPTEIDFDPMLGGQIVYYDWKSQHPGQFFHYGELYASKKFDEFTIAEFQQNGWSGGDGLVVSAPAKTRAEALQISNELMKARLLPGYPLA